eukprot:scaffold282193_cov31-Tisochrysis_lutea.AAC.2
MCAWPPACTTKAHSPSASTLPHKSPCASFLTSAPIALAAFIQVARRKTSLFDSIAGQFVVVTGVCAFAYTLAWPLETLKNCAQAGLPKPGASLAERLHYLGGPRGLYRGAAPGILCGGLRNGCAMMAMNGIANPLITKLGLRQDARR